MGGAVAAADANWAADASSSGVSHDNSASDGAGASTSGFGPLNSATNARKLGKLGWWLI